MYKKAMGTLGVFQVLLLAVVLLMQGTSIYQHVGSVLSVESGQRIVEQHTLQKDKLYELEETDIEALLRIVEAEAGQEDEEGKLLVANVILNRVKNDSFPDTVYEVVMQKDGGVTQFSPVANGRYYMVNISEETISAVERALNGEDISEGALYFAARKYANQNRMKWFDENLTYLFTHGGHEFFM